MATRFQDVYGRVTARDPQILNSLEANFRTNANVLIGQAGVEIECLTSDLEKALARIKVLETKVPDAETPAPTVQTKPEAATKLIKEKK